MKNKTLPYLTGRFFDGISSGLFMMALPWLMLKSPPEAVAFELGTFVALVALSCTALSFLLTPIFSTVIDRHSRKQLLVLVQIVQATTAGVVLVSFSLGVDSLWLLALAQLIFWVTSNLAWTANNAFTQENYRPEEYASISGKQEIILQGTTLGAGALGIVLLEVWSIIEFSAFAALASALSTISYMITPYQQQLRTSTRHSFTSQMIESKAIITGNPRFYAYLMLSAISYPVLTYLGKLVPVWFAQQGISGQWLAGYSMSFGLGALLTGLVVTRLLGMLSLPKTMLYAMAFSTVMVMGMSGAPHPAFILGFAFLFGLSNALNRIARTNWMHVTIKIEQRGRADGALQLFATFVQSSSYVIIALLSHYGVTQYGFAVAAATMLFAVVLMKWLTRAANYNEQELVNTAA
ncbi:MFS transporter [Vibrio ulleungensis]|uniref:MFS transporter n=1 Tax=Vibrio ulleungensis TaxID=2807619 RepID=A0ABS2HB34_9VIBR|nr:MFS transporter [Vibrio ulleungensis]MBM7034818.1 MFS transporter [Vibrio ulleungensis]